MTEYEFVDTIEELIHSTLEFYYKPEFWKAVLGSAPKYFVHFQNNDTHIFGLSKFCAFKNITIENYLTDYRHKIDGGTTQRHIARLTGADWMPRNKINNDIQQSFDNWISDFFPNYNIGNASFISLNKIEKIKRVRNKRITPDELQKKLEIQKEIGKVGEYIAMKFEIQRLSENGIKNSNKYVDQVSKINSAAGYDIYSSTKSETRYIEVKSSLNDNQKFIITENELHTLETLGKLAFIYLVHITDLVKKKGAVLQIINNPIKKLKDNGTLLPIAYRAEIKVLHSRDL